MDRQISSWFSKRRRTFLQLLGITAAGGLLPAVSESRESTAEQSFVLLQGDRCIPVTPLSGSEPVEELFDYAYPTDRFDGPPGSAGSTYSSEGTTHLQRDSTSILFLYDGPDGLSLVIVHGRLDGDQDAGGTVTFTLHGLSDGGTWIVRDDYYLTEDGEQASSNFDRWDIDGDVHTVDWTYRAGRTDGGAFRGLDSDLDVRIEPAFNDDAALSDEHDFGPIEDWQLLSGDAGDPDRYSLRLDRPVTVQTGTCPSTDDGSTETAAEGESRQQTKHERKQQKHQRKRERKHERKQRKHQRKQRKHERKQRKHERKQKKHD